MSAFGCTCGRQRLCIAQVQEAGVELWPNLPHSCCRLHRQLNSESCVLGKLMPIAMLLPTHACRVLGS